MSALKCAPPFNSFFHIRLHRTLLSFISFLFSFISFPVVLSSQISSLFFSFHFFISLSKQITGYLYSFTVCFPRGLASFLPFSFPNLLFFHMLSPAFPFSTIRGGNLIVIICQWNFFKKKNQVSSSFSTTSSPLDSNFFSLLTRDCNTAFTASDTPGTEDSSKLKIKHYGRNVC